MKLQIIENACKQAVTLLLLLLLKLAIVWLTIKTLV